jgi:hypothetical protein
MFEWNAECHRNILKTYWKKNNPDNDGHLAFLPNSNAQWRIQKVGTV